MCLLTKTSEQQKCRQDINLAADGAHSELHSKITSAAVQSSATFSVSQSVGKLEKTTGQLHQQISALKRSKPSEKAPSGGGDGPPQKKRKNKSRPAWTQLKQDHTLHYCGAFDKAKKQQCGWNSTHHFGEHCPVFKADSTYKPKFWGPLESGWDETKATTNVPVQELKPMYKRDVERWVAKNSG